MALMPVTPGGAERQLRIGLEHPARLEGRQRLHQRLGLEGRRVVDRAAMASALGDPPRT